MKCNQPGCRGVDHLGLCHACPHGEERGAALRSLPWSDHPCSRCKAGDSREQGHGRGYSYEAVPPGTVAEPAAESETFAEERLPTVQDQLRVILHALSQLALPEYVALLEYVRPNPDGSPRDLAKVASVVAAALHDREMSFQLVDMRIQSAVKKLAKGARIACGALRLAGPSGCGKAPKTRLRGFNWRQMA